MLTRCLYLIKIEVNTPFCGPWGLISLCKHYPEAQKCQDETKWKHVMVVYTYYTLHTGPKKLFLRVIVIIYYNDCKEYFGIWIHCTSKTDRITQYSFLIMMTWLPIYSLPNFPSVVYPSFVMLISWHPHILGPQKIRNRLFSLPASILAKYFNSRIHQCLWQTFT